MKLEALANPTATAATPTLEASGSRSIANISPGLFVHERPTVISSLPNLIFMKFRFINLTDAAIVAAWIEVNGPDGQRISPLSMHNVTSLQNWAPVPDSRQKADVVAREVYLKAMRQIASSVAVVTTDGQERRHGATVTAFCSVSADPPTLLVCLRTDSRISGAVKTNGVFTLSILPEAAEEQARAFTGEFDNFRADRFEGSALVERAGLAPAIGGALGFFCRVVRFEVQDSHTIFIGRVGEIIGGGPYPLTYLNGAYGCVQRDTQDDAAKKLPVSTARANQSK